MAAREAYFLYVEPAVRGRQRSRWALIIALADRSATRAMLRTQDRGPTPIEPPIRSGAVGMLLHVMSAAERERRGRIRSAHDRRPSRRVVRRRCTTRATRPRAAHSHSTRTPCAAWLCVVTMVVSPLVTLYSPP